jgi:beta-galactosidase
MWVKDRPVLALVPHWNWEGKDGQPIRVMALTNAERVALFLNGRLIEEKPARPFDTVEWHVPYAPGRLEAVAKRDGKEVARCVVETTGPATQIRLTPDRSSINADGEDVAVFTVSALDAHDRVVPLANNKINLSLAGAGRLIGVGNGDPNCHEPDTFVQPAGATDSQPWSRSLFNGLAQVIVQSTREAGELKLTAESDGLSPATVIVNTKPCAARPAVP